MKRHFFVCTNSRDADTGLPSCGANRGRDIADALRQGRVDNRLVADVYITETACLAPCPEQGTTIVVYPDSVWYVGVTLEDVPRIVDSHMVGGEPVADLTDDRWS